MMGNKKNDGPFSEIHAFLRKKEYTFLLKTMLDEDGRKLKEDFAIDKNHAWYCIGCAFFELGEFDKAKKSFLKAHSHEKNDCQSLMACANCLSEMKRPECAKMILEKSLGLNPKGRDRAAIIFNLGNALFDQGLYVDAIKKYDIVSRRKDAIGVAARKNNIHAHQLLREIDFY